MTTIEIILLVLVLPSTVLMFVAVIIASFVGGDKFQKLENYPTVSVIVAARNEEENIIDCLESLSKQNYPEGKWDVWVGNDRSEDSTLELVEDYIRDKGNFHIHNVTKNVGEAKGKGNVLAQLIQRSEGEVLLITDADVEPNPDWIKSMVTAAQGENIGVVTGVTATKSESSFGALQNLDWVIGFGIVYILGRLGISVSSSGNNMLIKRKAYEETGGYENMPFNIVEDYQLFNAARRKGWHYRNLFHDNLLAVTKPIGGLGTLMKQRKRWMKGATQLNLFLIFILMLHGAFYPAIVTYLFIDPETAATIWITKLFVQGFFVIAMFDRINRFKGTPYYLIYEFYAFALSTLMMFYFILPTKIHWKGRKY